MHVIRIAILMSLLLIGAYATHVADMRVKSYKTAKAQTSQWRKGLSETDYKFMRVALDSGNRVNGAHHGHASACIIVKNNNVVGTELTTADAAIRVCYCFIPFFGIRLWANVTEGA